METKRRTRIINLMDRGQTQLPADTETGTPSLERLLASYTTILEARTVLYPVPFQLRQELGRGRQGIVFLGLRHGARGCVTQHAIKVYDPSIYRSAEEYWTDMSRIAQQVSRLQHIHSPNLVMRHGYEENLGVGYTQLEAIDGMDLRILLDGKHLACTRTQSSPEQWSQLTRGLFRIEGAHMALQPGTVVYIMRRILRGLERLHGAGFLHFDIKPGNVMLDRLGVVRVVDFGRAVKIGERVSFLLGSPLYMAPEMHRREVCQPTADLYSLGMVGLEMLRGEPLAARDLPESALLELKQALPDRLVSLLPPDVRKNEALVHILRRLLSPDPTRRYASARDTEVGSDGLVVIDKQLVRSGLDTEYRRDLADYLQRTVDPQTNRIEAQAYCAQRNSTRRV